MSTRYTIGDTTYTVSREQVTWIRNGKNGQQRITHPTVYTVRVNGEDVCSFDTRRDAMGWIAAQH